MAARSWGSGSLTVRMRQPVKTAPLKMVYSIIELDNTVSSPDSDASERKSAARILAEIVEHFYLHPRTIESPKSINLPAEVGKAVTDKANDKDASPQDSEGYRAVGKAAEKPLAELSGAFDAILTEAHKRDLETQDVLDRHIHQRNFPSTERKGAGATFLLPSETSSGSSTASEFNHKGKTIEVIYKHSDLKVNGKSYGGLNSGDVVDLRLRGSVYVNNVERRPANEGAEQPGRPAQPATQPADKEPPKVQLD